MDPWLEQFWGDVHHRLVNYTCDQLEDRLPPELIARMNERVLVESDAGTTRPIGPDVRVVQQRRPQVPILVAEIPGVAVAEPLLVRLDPEPIVEGFIEIRDTHEEGRVITVIEVLSPTNKLPGPGQRLYLQKQEELREGSVSLVEIDLLRAGQRVLNVRPELLTPHYRTPYLACVLRGSDPATAEVYRIPLRERLPAIRIPLRPDDPDVPLDLQPLVDLAYRKGRYATSIDYRINPDPPLDPDDATWAEGLLSATGLR